MSRLNQTKYAFFCSLVYPLFPKDLSIRNVFIFTASDVVSCDGSEMSRRTSILVQIIFTGPLGSLDSL